jgi:hypothetical protein
VTITGLLTQQIQLDKNRFAIGNVTQADYIAETLSLLSGVDLAEVAASDGRLPASDLVPAAVPPAPSATERLRETWREVVIDVGILVRRAWIVVRQTVLDWFTPNAHRT